jgi:hypothetical protein
MEPFSPHHGVCAFAVKQAFPLETFERGSFGIRARFLLQAG